MLNMNHITNKKHYVILSCIFCISFITSFAFGMGVSDNNDSQLSITKKNVILITISSLRADHVGSYGYKRDTTPYYDEFVKNNISFANAFSVSSWMMPAYGSLFTSIYPSQHGATHIDNKLSDDPNTLAEILGENGYYCVGFSCNPRLDRENGFGRGFDFYDDYSVSLMLTGMSFDDKDETDINTQRTNDLTNSAAMRWLNNNTHTPFFMFVHYYDNHWHRVLKFQSPLGFLKYFVSINNI